MRQAARIIMAMIIGFRVLHDILHYGERRSGSEINAWVTIIAAFIEILLLKWGGFWG